MLSVERLLWASSFLLFCAVGITSATGQTFTSVFAFDGENGRYPDLMSLVQGVDGRLMEPQSTEAEANKVRYSR